jgi:choline dehydrogenase-like flavoprotein
MIYDLDLIEFSQTFKDAPICVIGAGIGGLLVAKKIADAKRPVIVIESGGLSFNPKYSALMHPVQPTDKYNGGCQVRSLGGGSTVWGGCMIPLTSHDLSSRPYVGVEGWPLSHLTLTKLLTEVEDLFELDHSTYDSHDMLGEELYSDVPSKCVGLVVRRPKFPTSKNGNLRYLLYNYIKESPYLHLWLNSTVTGFDVDPCQGRVSSIRAASLGHKTLMVHASHFVIACGTLESTRLLLLLDRTTNENAFRECDALGRYFHTHLKVDVGQSQGSIGRFPSWLGAQVVGQTRRSIHLEMTQEAQVNDKVASAYLTFRFASTRRLGKTRAIETIADITSSDCKGAIGSSRYKAHSTGGSNLEHYLHRYYWRLWRYAHSVLGDLTCTLEARIEQVPSLQNCLSLSNATDQMGTPFLESRWEQGSLEQETLNSLVKRGKDFWRSSGLDVSSPLDWITEELLNKVPMQDASHPAGSARMGVNRRSSVVNKSLTCHSIPNVQVVSAAVFPSSGGSNPTLTIMQLALHAAKFALDPKMSH